MYAGSLEDSVYIGQCPSGDDWSVRHRGKEGRVSLRTGIVEEVSVPAHEWRGVVLAFAAQIYEFYVRSEPKDMDLVEPSPEAEYGYLAFWREWLHRVNAARAIDGLAPIASADGFLPAGVAIKPRTPFRLASVEELERLPIGSAPRRRWWHALLGK
jgi:hypothetical protein